ncbi:MAG TPA: hypothetical protein VGC80_17695 [Acetobacteraceae bacterium]|jgi:hypothetical protein
MTEPPPSRTGALVAIAFILALVAGGYLLTRHLATISKTEDCLLAGRRNCAPVTEGTK